MCSSSIATITDHSEHTVVAFLGYFRQLVANPLDHEDTTIDGDGIIVEIDESKIGKQKYTHGNHVENV